MLAENIDTVTENGIQLASGKISEAEMVVTVTGLNLLQLGGINIVVDGKPINIANTCVYKGVMYSGISNLLNTFGYINASWTLRADLAAQYICKLINHMHSMKSVEIIANLPEPDANLKKPDLFEGFSPNYMKRVIHNMAKQVDKKPWVVHQNYRLGKQSLKVDPIDDDILIFSTSAERA